MWLGAIALPAIERLTGLHAEARSLRLTWRPSAFLGVRATSLTLTQPAQRPSAELIERPADALPQEAPALSVEAPIVEAAVRWTSLLRARLTITSVELKDPRIRITIPHDDSPLEREPRGSEAQRGEVAQTVERSSWPLSKLPDVEIVAGVIELVQRRNGRVETVASLTGDFRARQRNARQPIYDLRFTQTGPGELVDLVGWFNTATGVASVSADRVDLARWIESLTIERDEAFWRSIVTAGRLTSSTMAYSPNKGLALRTNIEGVQLSLPTPARSDRPSEPLVIGQVSGDIEFRDGSTRAKLTGLIDGLPTKVALNADGLSLTTPFRLELTGGPFRFDQRWTPFSLAPEVARELLDDFSGPSAEVQGRVTLVRRVASSAVDEGISIVGEATIANGSASFVEFPYPLHTIAGVVKFDDSSIRLERLTGVGPTGARVEADGLVIPDGARVGLDLTIHAENAPVDEPLLSAIGGEKREIIEQLFDRAQFDRLHAEGLFVTKEDQRSALRSAGPVQRELQEAAVPSAPEFDLAGLARVDVRIQREAGRDESPRVELDAHFDRAGLVDRFFPYPVWVEPLDLHIGADRIDIVDAPLIGLTGAEGAITGSIVYDSASAAPDLRIEFGRTPVDETLLSAIALIDAPASAGRASRPSATLLDNGRDSRSTVRQQPGRPFHRPAKYARILRKLGPSGSVHGEARITKALNDQVAYDVSVPLSGLRLRFGAEDERSDEPLLVDSFTGEARITRDGVRVENASAMVGESAVAFSMEARNDEASPAIVRLHSVRFRVQEPIEPLVRVFSGSAADRIESALRVAPIAGAVAFAGEFNVGQGVSSSRFELTGAGDLVIGSAKNKTVARPTRGRLIVQSDQVIADDLTLEVAPAGAIDPKGAGVVSITGVVALNPKGAEDGAGELSIIATNLPLASALAVGAVGLFTSESSAWMKDAEASFQPEGRADAQLSIRRGRQGWRIDDGVIQPRSLSFTRRGQRIVLDPIEGEITVGPTGGEIRTIRAAADGWTLNVDGAWFAGVTPGFDVQLSATGRRLSRDVIALLPAEVANVLGALRVNLDGGFELRNASLSLNAPVKAGALRVDIGDSFRDGVRFEGDIRVLDASFIAGVPFTRIDGAIHLIAQRPPQAQAMSLDLSIGLNSLRIAGLKVRNVTGGVHSSDSDERALDVDALGESHGGRLWTHGVIHTGRSDLGTPGAYEFDVRVAGLDLDSALRDRDDSADNQPAPANGRRGRVDASIVLGGTLTKHHEPRGAGEIRLLGGEFARVPLVMRILELGNLIPKKNEALDFARARFTLDNGVASFDQLLAVSPTISLIGEGTVSASDLRLDLRFGAASNRRLPLLSAFLDVLRNELLTTRVGGTLAHPSFSVVQLSGTRRFLSRLLGFNHRPDTTQRAVPQERSTKPVVAAPGEPD